MGRPARFTHAQLQAAALRLLDREGLAGLSMRSLAAELGTGAMTLYNYVPQREAIDLLVIEAVLAEVAWDRGPYAAWADEVRAIATALWRAVLHPGVFWSGLRWVLSTGRFYRKAENGIQGLPADFLVDARGRVVACKYGQHADDHWEVDDLLKRVGDAVALPASGAPRPGTVG